MRLCELRNQCKACNKPYVQAFIFAGPWNNFKRRPPSSHTTHQCRIGTKHPDFFYVCPPAARGSTCLPHALLSLTPSHSAEAICPRQRADPVLSSISPSSLNIEQSRFGVNLYLLYFLWECDICYVATISATLLRYLLQHLDLDLDLWTWTWTRSRL